MPPSLDQLASVPSPNRAHHASLVQRPRSRFHEPISPEGADETSSPFLAFETKKRVKNVVPFCSFVFFCVLLCSLPFLSVSAFCNPGRIKLPSRGSTGAGLLPCGGVSCERLILTNQLSTSFPVKEHALKTPPFYHTSRIRHVPGEYNRQQPLIVGDDVRRL
jgi:hypothetical protein